MQNVGIRLEDEEILDCDSDDDWQSNQSKNVVKSVLTATVEMELLLNKEGW
jgi:hypothetical protein